MPPVRVLIAEDDAVVATDVVATLEEFGYAVSAVAATGDEAVRLARAARPDLALLDIRLPGPLDGIGVARRLRREHRIPVVFLTAYADPRTLGEALDAAPFGYVLKPFTPAALRTTLEVALVRHGAERVIQAREQGQRQLVEELRRAKQDLEALQLSVAHDLRSPLRSLQGLGHVLLELGDEMRSERRRELLERMLDATRRLDALITDLLAYGRVSLSDFEPVPTDLAAAVERAVEAVDADRRSAGGTLDVAIDPALPAVSGRPRELEQAVVNLLTNALKFVKPGERAAVRVTARAVGKACRLEVEDEGIGVAPGDRQQIFGLFTRLHAEEDYPGTGLGLAIVRLYVARMGGRVGVDEAEGGGCRFWIELPLARARVVPIPGLGPGPVEA